MTRRQIGLNLGELGVLIALLGLIYWQHTGQGLVTRTYVSGEGLLPVERLISGGQNHKTGKIPAVEPGEHK